MEEELNIRKVYNDELRKWQGKPLTSNGDLLWLRLTLRRELA